MYEKSEVMTYDQSRLEKALVKNGVSQTGLEGYLQKTSDAEEFYRFEEGDVNELARDVLKSKYLGPKETGPLQMWDRIARSAAGVESSEEQKEESYDQFMGLLADNKFLPGGRIMHGAGREDARRQPTMSNCYVIPITGGISKDYLTQPNPSEEDKQIRDILLELTDEGFDYQRAVSRLQDEEIPDTTIKKAVFPGDSVEGIYQHLEEAALVYRSGGGVGTDISGLRPSGASVNSTVSAAPGATTFMHLLSESTETVAQEGRRGALMLTIKSSHPDVYKFVEIKDDENRTKVKHANVSVLLDDEFMEAVKDDSNYQLHWETKDPLSNVKPVTEIIKARDLWNKIIEKAHASAEPGIIFWETMQNHHNLEYAAPLESTNPCVVGSTLVPTSKGLKRIDSFIEDETEIATGINISNSGNLLQTVAKRKIKGSFKTGTKFTYKLITKSGYELIATKDHKILTPNGWVELKDLKISDKVLLQSEQSLFNTSKNIDFSNRKWSRDLGLMLGWITGDGWFIEKGKNCRAGFVFGNTSIKYLKRIKDIFNTIYGKKIKEVTRKNKVVHLSYHSREFIDFLSRLGVKSVKADRKRIPESIFTAPKESIIGFLQGLYSTDGTINIGKNKTRYIRLTSKSEKLLKDVQLLLINFGIKSKIYERHREKRITFRYKTTRGELRLYESDGILYELQISKDMIPLFLDKIGFIYDIHEKKIKRLKKAKYYRTEFSDDIISIEDNGWEDVFDLTEPVTHSFIGNGIIIHNCGEQPLAAYTACNLSNINLAEFVSADGQLDYEELAEATRIGTRFLDNIVTYNQRGHALEKIVNAVEQDRRIGLGITGLADALAKIGLRYDSEEALEEVDKIMKIVRNNSYETSIDLAEERGAFPLFDWEGYSQSKFVQSLPEEMQERIKKVGIRNGTVLTAPPVGTGSIIAQTASGIEPFFAVSYKRKVKDKEGKDTEYDVVDPAVRRLFGSEIEDIPDHVVTSHNIDPFFRVKMQGVIQKYIDTAISSTINLPKNTPVETVADIYMTAWKEGLKGVTVYREGSREGIMVTTDEPEIPLEDKVKSNGFIKPRDRPSVTSGKTEKVRTGDGSIFITINEDEQGVCELFTTIGKSGGKEQAYTEATARLASLALRGGMDPQDVVDSLKGISGPNPMYDGGRLILSPPDAMGKVLEKYLKGNDSDESYNSDDKPDNPNGPDEISELEEKTEEDVVKFESCPECHQQTLKMESSCESCVDSECGYTRCSG